MNEYVLESKGIEIYRTLNRKEIEKMLEEEECKADDLIVREEPIKGIALLGFKQPDKALSKKYPEIKFLYLNSKMDMEDLKVWLEDANLIIIKDDEKLMETLSEMKETSSKVLAKPEVRYVSAGVDNDDIEYFELRIHSLYDIRTDTITTI